MKQHGMPSFENLENRLLRRGTPVTLMTPEPTGGYYMDSGVERFIQEYGYPDRTGRPDRMNFGGIYKYGVVVGLTQVEMLTRGFDNDTGKIDLGTGKLILVRKGQRNPIAEWRFTDLLRHWTRKHLKAVYVPSMCRKEPNRAYRFANVVRLAEGTDFARFLRAIHEGLVYYDPGIKLEKVLGVGKVKRRSQFRIYSGNLSRLYDKMTTQSLP